MLATNIRQVNGLLGQSLRHNAKAGVVNALSRVKPDAEAFRLADVVVQKCHQLLALKTSVLPSSENAAKFTAAIAAATGALEALRGHLHTLPPSDSQRALGID